MTQKKNSKPKINKLKKKEILYKKFNYKII